MLRIVWPGGIRRPFRTQAARWRYQTPCVWLISGRRSATRRLGQSLGCMENAAGRPGATNDLEACGARESGGQPRAVQTLREISNPSLRAERLDCGCFSTALERGCAWLGQNKRKFMKPKNRIMGWPRCGVPMGIGLGVITKTPEQKSLQAKLRTKQWPPFQCLCVPYTTHNHPKGCQLQMPTYPHQICG